MIEIQRITDIARLMRWRAEVLESVFGAEPSADVLTANREYYEAHVADGSHMAFVAVDDGAEAGCGAACAYDEMPSPDNPSGRCFYIMNMYVRPGFRHEGVAKALLRHLIDEAHRRGCGKIYLETTDMGRRLYAHIGFRDMKDMMIYED